MLNTTARQNTTPRTVLVVEDEPTLATAIAQRITAEGWTARVAGDGASAVQAASQHALHGLQPVLVYFARVDEFETQASRAVRQALDVARATDRFDDLRCS